MSEIKKIIAEHLQIIDGLINKLQALSLDLDENELARILQKEQNSLGSNITQFLDNFVKFRREHTTISQHIDYIVSEITSFVLRFSADFSRIIHGDKMVHGVIQHGAYETQEEIKDAFINAPEEYKTGINLLAL